MNKRMRNFKRVTIDDVTLRQLIHLPEKAAVEKVFCSPEFGGELQVVVSHPSFPNAPTGEWLLILIPTMRCVDGELRLSWGLEEEVLPESEIEEDAHSMKAVMDAIDRLVQVQPWFLKPVQQVEIPKPALVAAIEELSDLRSEAEELRAELATTRAQRDGTQRALDKANRDNDALRRHLAELGARPSQPTTAFATLKLLVDGGEGDYGWIEEPSLTESEQVAT